MSKTKFTQSKVKVAKSALFFAPYFSELSSKKIKKVSAMIKDSKVEEFYKALDNYGIRKIERDGIAVRPTLHNIHGGKDHDIGKRKAVQWKTAKTICESLGLKTENYFEKITNEQGYRKETILGYKRVLSAIYTFAVEHEIVPKNLASGTFVNEYIGGEQAMPKEILSDDEVDNLIKVLDKHSNTENGIQDTIAIYLLTFYGLRKCELCGINWNDIDFDNKTLHIQRNRVYVPHYGKETKGTKTSKQIKDSSNRVLPIFEPIYSKLIAYKKWWDE